MFKAGAAFLDEGGLDTRTYGKRIVWHVKAMLASRAEFDRLVHSVTPESLHRKVVDTVEGLNGPPPPPSRAVAGGVPGSRLASRQLGPGGTPASPMRPILDGAMGGGMMGGPGAGAGGGGGGGGGMGGSLTQNPPPMRQSSYSAPSPLGAAAGGATPERRRGLGRQRTSDLDGIPEGPGSSNTSGNGRLPPRSAAAAGGGGGGGGGGAGGSLSARGSSGSGGGGANGDGGGGGFGPAVQETVVKSLLMLTAKDFRERIEALRAVEGVVGSLPGAPDSLLIQLLDALVARLGDANAKVRVVGRRREGRQRCAGALGRWRASWGWGAMGVSDGNLHVAHALHGGPHPAHLPASNTAPTHPPYCPPAPRPLHPCLPIHPPILPLWPRPLSRSLPRLLPPLP